MCLICAEVMKGRMTKKDIERAAREVVEPHTEAQIKEVTEYIEKYRPDLQEEPGDGTNE